MGLSQINQGIDYYIVKCRGGMMSKERVHLIVYGRVQGVGFRFTTQLKANEIGVNGWVKNREDGTVEIEAEGKVEKVDQFIDAVKANPSPVAKIESIELTICDDLKGYQSFKTLY